MVDTLNASEKTVRCEDCGARFEKLPWSPGAPCPKCGSSDFGPVPTRGGVSDYAAADRSAAFALEDIRFGRLAQWAGFITPKQLQYALYQQKQFVAAGRKVPDIGALFMQEKVMSRPQVQAVLAARRSQPRNTEDAEFAAAARRLGQATEAQITECRRMQDEAAQAGYDAVPLPLLLYEKRYMQENQILALMMNFERQNTGLLPRIRRLAEPVKAKPLKEQILGEPHSLGRYARVGVFCIVAVFILYSSVTLVKRLTPDVKVRCEKCLGEFFASPTAGWPVKCPNCGAKEAYSLVLCQNCGEIYLFHGGIGYGAAAVCPKCHGTHYELITAVMDRNMAQVQADIRAKKSATDRGE